MGALYVAKIEDVQMKARIYNYILEMILRRQVLPGEKIPEVEIAAALQVSRTPVREAIRRLAWEGLITIEPNKSATVRVLDEDTIHDLAVVRWQNEKLNIPLAVYNGSNKDFDELREYAEKCIACNRAGDMSGRHKYDSRFHLKLFEIGGNRILYEIQQRLELIIQLWQVHRITEPEIYMDGLEQHYKIVDYLEKRDTDVVLDLMYQHCAQSYGVSVSK